MYLWDSSCKMNEIFSPQTLEISSYSGGNIWNTYYNALGRPLSLINPHRTRITLHLGIWDFHGRGE